MGVNGNYFVRPPWHPSVFGVEADPEAQRDFLGWARARQNMVCSLVQGPEEACAAGQAIARAKRELFQPDWNKVFRPEAIMRSVRNITSPPLPA